MCLCYNIIVNIPLILVNLSPTISDIDVDDDNNKDNTMMM